MVTDQRHHQQESGQIPTQTAVGGRAAEQDSLHSLRFAHHEVGIPDGDDSQICQIQSRHVLQQWSVVLTVVHLRLTVIKGLGPSATEGVTRNGPHRVGNVPIINGTSSVLNVLRSIGENSKLEGLQHHRLVRLLKWIRLLERIRLLNQIMTVLLFKSVAKQKHLQRFLRSVTALF